MSLAHWFVLCESIGIPARDLDPMQVYIYGGRIIEDREVRLRNGVGFGKENPPALKYQGKNAAEIIATFTKDERLALRDRVLGVKTISTERK